MANNYEKNGKALSSNDNISINCNEYNSYPNNM